MSITDQAIGALSSVEEEYVSIFKNHLITKLDLCPFELEGIKFSKSDIAVVQTFTGFKQIVYITFHIEGAEVCVSGYTEKDSKPVIQVKDQYGWVTISTLAELGSVMKRLKENEQEAAVE